MNHVFIPSDLLPKIAQGNKDAFEQLYQLTYKPVFSFLLSLTMNQEDANDLLQETYLRVYGSAHMYHHGNPMAWIMKIGKNLFLMEKRKKKPEPISDPEVQTDLQIGLDTVENVETRILLEQLFLVLSEEEREIVVMHVTGGFRHREIAEILNMPIGTVLVKYNRAMKKLKKSAKDDMKGANHG